VPFGFAFRTTGDLSIISPTRPRLLGCSGQQKHVFRLWLVRRIALGTNDVERFRAVGILLGDRGHSFAGEEHGPFRMARGVRSCS
jgi:hypothetical protein